MARDFLLGSKTHREKVPLKIQLRRHFICEELDEYYELPRGRGPVVASKAASAIGDAIDARTVYREIRIYRTAAVYLSSDEESKTEFRQKLRNFNPKHTTDQLFGVWCMVTDQIDSMEAIEQNLDEQIREAETRFSEMLAKRKSEKIEAVKAEITYSGDKFEAPPALLSAEVLDSIDTLRKGYELSVARQNELHLALAERERENAALKDENAYLYRLIERLRGERESIREMRLEELVELFPQATALYRLVQEIQNKTRQEGTYERMLPRITKWNEEELLVEYLPRFREQFRAFAAREQGQIVSAIQRLTSSPEACFNSGFDTQKMRKSYPGTPDEFLKSRSSREIRLGWQKEGPVIYFYIVFRKGDKDYVETEA